MEQNQETGRQFNMGELREEKLLEYNLQLNVAGSTIKRSDLVDNLVVRFLYLEIFLE